MSVDAGAPIDVAAFAAELDDHETRIGGVEAHVADLEIRAQRVDNNGYKSHTAGDSDQIIANSAALFSSIAVSINTIASRVLKVQLSCRATSATDKDIVTFLLMDDDVGVVISAGDATMAADDGLDTVSFFALVTPTAGFHTYRLYITMTNGVGPGGYIGSGPSPAWLLVEDIGEPA